MNRFEIYKSFEKRPRTYLIPVDKNNKENLIHASRFFHQNYRKIGICEAWIVSDEMYLTNPRKKGQKKTIAFYVRRKGE